MYVYVASSWRNTFQPSVVAALRADGFEVYDFKDADGFHWTEVDPKWQAWPNDIQKYLDGLNNPIAQRGFARDMNALKRADLCVMVMPCGMSASLETGYAIGAGKPTAIYVPGLREPDLMVKMANFITRDLGALRLWAHGKRSAMLTADLDRAFTLAADVQLATHSPSAQGDGDRGSSRSTWEGEV